MTGREQKPHPPVSQQTAEAFQRILPRSRLLQRSRKYIPMLVENAIHSIPDDHRLLEVALGTNASTIWAELPVAIVVTDKALVLGGAMRGTVILHSQITGVNGRESLLGGGQTLIIDGKGGRKKLQRIEPVTAGHLAELMRNPPPTAELPAPVDRRMVSGEAIFLAGNFVGNRSRGGLTTHGALRMGQHVMFYLRAGSDLQIYPGKQMGLPVIAEYTLPTPFVSVTMNTESGISQMSGPLQRSAAASLGVGSVLTAAGFSALTSGLGALAVVGAGAGVGARRTSRVTYLVLVEDGTDYGIFAPLASDVPGQILASQSRTLPPKTERGEKLAQGHPSSDDAPSAVSRAAQEIRKVRALYEAGELSEQDFEDWKTEIMRNARRDP